ncbi:endonuclease [Pantoea phage Phynn]|nr:endonuclease [Pantoea phage Phynn]
MLTKRITKKEYPALKQALYDQQNGACAICKRPLEGDINKHHLDHDHALTGDNAGRVRGLLCNLCNGTEGIMKHKFNRSGLVAKDVEYIEWLENLLSYLKEDKSDNKIHDRFIPDKVKWFSRLTKPAMIVEMGVIGFDCDENAERKALISSYRKQLMKATK